MQRRALLGLSQGQIISCLTSSHYIERRQTLLQVSTACFAGPSTGLAAILAQEPALDGSCLLSTAACFSATASCCCAGFCSAAGFCSGVWLELSFSPWSMTTFVCSPSVTDLISLAVEADSSEKLSCLQADVRVYTSDWLPYYSYLRLNHLESESRQQ